MLTFRIQTKAAKRAVRLNCRRLLVIGPDNSMPNIHKRRSRAADQTNVTQQHGFSCKVREKRRRVNIKESLAHRSVVGTE
jgi:hypothetical protein